MLFHAASLHRDRSLPKFGSVLNLAHISGVGRFTVSSAAPQGRGPAVDQKERPRKAAFGVSYAGASSSNIDGCRELEMLETSPTALARISS